MKVYNFMSGQNFGHGAFSMEFYKAWIFLAILVLIIMIAKKWLGEEQMAGMDYSWLWGIGGVFIYFIFVSLTGLTKIGFVIGLFSVIFLGFLGGKFNG